MNTKKLKISKTLLAVMMGSALVCGSAMAETTATDKAQSTANTAGEKIDNSMNKVGNFMDDSSITAKVKAALVDADDIKSTDMCVTVKSSLPKAMPAILQLPAKSKLNC